MAPTTRLAVDCLFLLQKGMVLSSVAETCDVDDEDAEICVVLLPRNAQTQNHRVRTYCDLYIFIYII